MSEERRIAGTRSRAAGRQRFAALVSCAVLAMSDAASADPPAPPPTPPPTPPSATPAPPTGVSAKGLSIETGGSFEESEKVRARWLERGGALLGFDVQAAAWGFVIPRTGGGGGGQLAAHGTFYYFAPPDPTKAETTWFAGRIGSGVEAGAGYAGILYQYFTPLQVTIPLAVGGQIGFGSHRGMSEWRGVMIGLDYRPSYTYIDFGRFGRSSSFSFVGGQVTIDIVTMKDVRERLAAMVKEPKWRFSAFFIPRIGDVPWFFSVGFGAAWY